jgi:putative Ca2+/H+ antiporter (TMEM165/GDT1 family)
MIWIFFTTWSMVLSAEIVGDKSLYTIGSLATRYWALPIFLGSAVAFMIKMLVAVLFASLLSRLPEWLVISLNAATFLSIAFILWFKLGEPKNDPHELNKSWIKIASTSMAGILFTEWGDVGQLTAATLAIKYHLPLIIWSGAVLAMMTKSILVIIFGKSLKRFLSQNILRYLTSALFIMMAVLSLIYRD